MFNYVILYKLENKHLLTHIDGGVDNDNNGHGAIPMYLIIYTITVYLIIYTITVLNWIF